MKHLPKTSQRRAPPALTPEARENQLISRAYDLVEQRLIDGSATSQETTFFLKAGSQHARMEMEKLRHENELLRAKTEAIESSKQNEELYMQVIDALQRYGGGDEEDDFDANI